MDGAPAPTPTRPQLSVVASAPDHDPAVLWRLLSRPALWPRWAPHIRRVTTRGGTDTLGVGDRVRIHGPPGVRVTALITRLEVPHRWDFRVELPLGHHLEATHEVLDPAAVRVQMWLHGPLPSPAGTALLAAYRPVAALAVHRLVALAGDRR